jgi:hypothetical protein
LLFVSNFLFVTPNANAQTASPIIYGKTYYIQNGYLNWTGGYLDTNSSGCEGNKYCVSTANTPNRANVETGTWKILSASGKSNGTPVLVGDNIHLQNLYLGDGGYLDTNSSGCEGNKYCVSTANTPNRANANTGTWKILSSNKQNGTSLLVNDDIYLQNLFSGDGGYLDTNSAGCEGNKYCVSTSVSKERAPGSGTNHWRLIARNPEPAPIPTPTPPPTPTTGEFQVSTNSATGFGFTNSQTKEISYKFTPSGTWKPKTDIPDCTAAGLKGFGPEIQTPLSEALKPYQENLKYLNNTTFALLAVNKTTGKVIEVGQETTIVLKPGETLTFLVNDFTPNYGDNTGTLTVKWSAT